MTEHKIKSFGRRRCRGLGAEKSSLVDNDLAIYKFIPESIPISNKYALEIGFGNGERLAQDAIRNPDTMFIGCEPFMNGVGELLRNIRDSNIENIRIYPDDVRNILPMFPTEFLEKIYILYADPWPKTRHHKRRIIQKEFLELLAPKLKQTGKIIIATDHAEYAKYILNEIFLSKLFTIKATHAEDLMNFPADWIKTKYQQKAEEKGIKSFYIELTKRTIE